MSILHLLCQKLLCAHLPITSGFLKKAPFELTEEGLCDRAVCRVGTWFPFETGWERDTRGMSSGLQYFVNFN